MYDTEASNRLKEVDGLKLAIRREYEQGLGEFSTVHTSYFLPPAVILDKSTAYIRRWFLVVRSRDNLVQLIWILIFFN